MRTRRTWTALRPQLCVFAPIAAASVVVLAYVTVTMRPIARFNDFYREALPAYDLLAKGNVVGFFHSGPLYVGSLVLRAPIALIPELLHLGRRAVFFASALPCLLAASVFASWLAGQPRRESGITTSSRLAPALLCIFNPLVVIAVFDGHPEEILGAVLCVAAVAAATRGRPGLAGLLVVLAVVNKSWALVAVPVVVAALPTRRRGALAALSAGGVAVGLAMLALRSNALSPGADGVEIGTIFNPPQLLWWFGHHSWIARHAREVIVLVSVACCVPWVQRRGRVWPASEDATRALLLLALVLLVRAALDPWNNAYYHVPFLFALLAYEVTSGRKPRLTIIYTGLLLFVVPLYGVPSMSFELRAALYAITIVPTIVWMAVTLYTPARADAWVAAALRRDAELSVRPEFAAELATDSAG